MSIKPQFGGDKNLIGRTISVRWTQHRTMAIVGGKPCNLKKVAGSIAMAYEDELHFPARPNVSLLVVERDDGVRVVIPYNAFLVKGVEVELELPAST